MSQDSLRELLARVHERLGSSGSLDGASRAQLAALLRDIERALGAGGTPARAKAAQTAPAHAPRLETLAVRFEAGHPELAETLRELGDALVKAGI
jgi:hypothetical protein